MSASAQDKQVQTMNAFFDTHAYNEEADWRNTPATAVDPVDEEGGKPVKGLVVVSLKSNPNHRPAGSPDGGQFAPADSVGSDGSAKLPQGFPVPAESVNYTSKDGVSLFHYTTPDAAKKIEESGFDLSANSMYGKGVYFTDRNSFGTGERGSTRVEVSLNKHNQLVLKNDTDVPEALHAITGHPYYATDARQAMITAGFGSMRFPVDGELYTVVFDPTLIKVGKVTPKGKKGGMPFVKFNPNHAPGGSPEGGEFTSGDGGSGSSSSPSKDELDPTKNPKLRDAIDAWIEGFPSKEEVTLMEAYVKAAPPLDAARTVYRLETAGKLKKMEDMKVGDVRNVNALMSTARDNKGLIEGVVGPTMEAGDKFGILEIHLAAGKSYGRDISHSQVDHPENLQREFLMRPNMDLKLTSTSKTTFKDSFTEESVTVPLWRMDATPVADAPPPKKSLPVIKL